jgi:hypothetical protein
VCIVRTRSLLKAGPNSAPQSGRLLPREGERHSDFGRFEQDTLDRSLAARYYATAYRALAELTAADAARVESDLRLALTAFQAQRYRSAVSARAAWICVIDAAGPAVAARGRAGGAGRSRGDSASGAVDRVELGPVGATAAVAAARFGVDVPPDSLRDGYLARVTP